MRWPAVLTVSMTAGLATAVPLAAAQNNAPNSSLTASQVVANVQAVNAQTKVLSADFTQEYLAKAYNTMKTSNGHVVLSGTSSDWSYATPAGNRVVSNGTHECVYEAATNELYIRDVVQSQYSVVALLTQTNLARNFTFTVAAVSIQGLPSGYALTGTPTTPTITYTKVIIYVDGRTFEIRRVMMLDTQQNRNLIEFTNVQRNAPKSNATFVIHAPAGATFIGPSGKTSSAPATCP